MSDGVRALREKRLKDMEESIEEIRKRVFNGLGSELRCEMDKSIAGLRNLVIGLLISIFLGLAGIVIEGRVSSNAASQENMRNYKAIVDLEKKIDIHMQE